MLLSVKELYKTFKTEGIAKPRTVLDGVNLELKKGQAISILGPSGSGKSTLMNIIGALDKPDQGEVIFNGQSLGNMTEKELTSFRNREIGFVFQMHHLLPQLSLLENVLVPVIPQKDKSKRKVAKDKAMELIDFVGLTDKITQRPGQMSVGECQRTAVVRALINKPEILLADEPTGSLDQETAEQMGELLQHINSKQNIATVVVTHSQKLANKMGRIYKITNGKLVE